MGNLGFLGGFNANQERSWTGGATLPPIPEGAYLVKAVDAKFLPNYDNTGTLLEVIFSVSEGRYAGRQVIARYNLENVKPRTVATAKAELAAFCKAIGITAPKDTSELLGLPLLLSVYINKYKGSDDKEYFSNKISAYNPAPKQTSVKQEEVYEEAYEEREPGWEDEEDYEEAPIQPEPVRQPVIIQERRPSAPYRR